MESLGYPETSADSSGRRGIHACRHGAYGLFSENKRLAIQINKDMAFILSDTVVFKLLCVPEHEVIAKANSHRPGRKSNTARHYNVPPCSRNHQTSCLPSLFESHSVFAVTCSALTHSLHPHPYKVFWCCISLMLDNCLAPSLTLRGERGQIPC